MKTISKAGLKVLAGVKAGGLYPNHSRKALKVTSTVKAGGLYPNHNRINLRVRSGLKAGMDFGQNHSRRFLAA